MTDVMEGWSDLYTLIGSTAATLIGLIFVVISLGADRVKKGDEHRARIGVVPLVAVLHNSGEMTLIIVSRPGLANEESRDARLSLLQARPVI